MNRLHSQDEWITRAKAVLPAGVETSTPSDTSFLIIVFDPFLICKEAACLLCLSIETSFIANDFFTLFSLFITIISKGDIEIIFALGKFFTVSLIENLFIKNP